MFVYVDIFVCRNSIKLYSSFMFPCVVKKSQRYHSMLHDGDVKAYPKSNVDV